MSTQQFFKGLLMALVAVVVAAFSTAPIDFLLLAVTAVCTIITYFGKNMISWLHSDSPPASLSLINIASGVLIAIGAALTESVGTYLINGAILWPVVLNVTAYTAGTYLLSTFFAPPYSVEKKRFFATREYKARYLKKFAIIGLLVTMSAGLSAQKVFDGFWKPKAGTEVTSQFKAEGDQSYSWFVRPAATLTAVQFTYDKDLKTFKSSVFSSAGIGLGLQHYVEKNGVLVNNYGVNALLILDASEAQGGYAVAGTVNALQFVNVGAGYNFTGKQFFLLTGAVWTF